MASNILSAILTTTMILTSDTIMIDLLAFSIIRAVIGQSLELDSFHPCKQTLEEMRDLRSCQTISLIIWCSVTPKIYCLPPI